MSNTADDYDGMTVLEAREAVKDAPEFGNLRQIVACRLLRLYADVLAIERPWRLEIPPLFRVEPTWTRDALESRKAELALLVDVEEK